MRIAYLIVSGMYALIFGLPDLVGDARANTFAKWWLERARQSLRLFTKQSTLVSKYLGVGATVLLLCVLFSLPFIPMWLFVFKGLPYFYDPNTPLLPFLLPQDVIYILFSLVMLALNWLFIDSVKSLLSKAFRTDAIVKKDLAGPSISAKPRSSPEVVICHRLFALIEGGSLLVLERLLSIAVVAGVVGGFIGPLLFFVSQRKTLLVQQTVFIVLFAPLALFAVIDLVIPLVLLVGSGIRLLLFISLVIPWALLLAPPLLLNRLADLTGQPLFLKVGKYFFLFVGIIVGFLLLKK